MKVSLWAEKYRPLTFEGLICKEKSKVQEYLQKPMEMPHFLFYGSPGTGKSTLARVILSELQPDSLIINGSDDTGIENIRNKVKPFVSNARYNKTVPKICLIEEADFLSKASQTALRAMMEQFSSNARFIFTLNYIEKIDDALKSRCVRYKIQQQDKEEIRARLREILKSEGVTWEEEAIEKILFLNYPDIRACINALQEFTENNELKLAKVISKDELERQVYDLLKQKKFIDARKLWITKGLLPTDLVKKFNEWLMEDTDIKNKGSVLIELGEASYRLGKAIDEESVFAAQMYKIIRLL